MNPKAALFIAGAELNLLEQLTQDHGLAPFDYEIVQIHKEVALYGKGWPYVYWASGPFLTVEKDWQRRYATVFLKR